MKSENGPSQWKCSQCEKEFKYESEKRRHEQSHAPQFECKVCSKKFSFLSALRRHEKQHERTGSVSCKECDRKFRDEALLKRHMQYAHKGIYTCSKCKSTYHSEVALRTHMKIHKPISEWKYHCSFHGCSKKFNFAHHLKHHELTHTNVKPHICKDCDQRFIQLHHLKAHQRLHQPDSWLYCTEPSCTKRFTNEYALKRHIATHSKRKESSVLKTKLSVKPSRRAKESNQYYESSVAIITCTPKGRMLEVEPLLNSSINVLKTADISEDYANDSDNSKQVLEYVSVDTNKLDIDINEDKSQSTEIEKEDFISNCQSVLGKCIVTGDSEISENCLCAQVEASETVQQNASHRIIDNNNVIRKLSEDQACIEKRRKNANACETCECASICDIKAKDVKNATPEFEYRNDGVIKIKDTFDIDFEISNKEDKTKEFSAKLDLNMKAAGISSCKDVLGNCIVSGNGMMGDGCLCARMTAEDQEITEQEIDEITPHPSSIW